MVDDRILKRVLFLLLFVFALCPVCAAEEAVSPENIWSTIGEILPKAEPSIREAILLVLKMTGFSALYGSICAIAGETVYLRITGITLLAMMTVGNTSGFYGVVQNTVEEVMVVIHTSLPALTAYSALAGQTASVITSQAVYLTFLDITAILISHMILPLVGGIFAFAVIAGATQNESLKKIGEAIKSITIFLLKIALTVFIGYTGVIKIFGTIGDSIAKRGIRLAVSSSVPVIGSIAAEAAEGVLAVASVTKSLSGIAGIIAVLTAGLLPMVQIGIFYLMIRFFSFFAPAFGGEALGDFAEKIADGYSVLFATAAALLILALLAILSTFVYAVIGG